MEGQVGLAENQLGLICVGGGLLVFIVLVMAWFGRKSGRVIDCPECDGGERPGRAGCPTCAGNDRVRRGGDNLVAHKDRWGMGGVMVAKSTRVPKAPRRKVRRESDGKTFFI